MGNFILIAVFLGSLKVTAYRSIEAHTDSSPFTTSTGERVSPRGVAVSRDLLCGACRKLHKRCKHPGYAKKIHYGDLLYIEDIGYRFVNDIMGETMYDKKLKKRLPIRNQLDIWCGSYKEEQAHHKKFGKVRIRAWKIQSADVNIR